MQIQLFFRVAVLYRWHGDNMQFVIIDDNDNCCVSGGIGKYWTKCD